tara:strand:- start:5704 stop:6126 length:423 start_codon:yes stop_codon:yes gene_type:complete
MLYCLCYISKKSDRLTAEGVNEMIRKSSVYNDANSITGVLIEYKTDFLQYLEGDAVEIYNLFNKIKMDKRHFDVSLLQYSPVEGRIFSEWAMIHKDLNRLSSTNMDAQIECAGTIEEILSQKAFWKGLEAIEMMSNLIEA